MSKDNRKTVRFNDEAYNYINNYPVSERDCTDFTTKLEAIIAASDIMYYYTKRELSTILTIDEACLLCDLNNSTLYNPKINALLSLCVSIEDGDKYEGLGQKWNVNIDELLDKVKNMSIYQAHCIYLMCNEFWNMSDEDRHGKDLKEIVSDIFGIRR